MVSIKWCNKQEKGIKMVVSNDNLATSYLKMAEGALGTMNREKKFNMVFAISACYYSMYYSLYAVLRKIGIKCEIHSCSIKFMDVFLSNFYIKEDVEIIRKAFDARNTIQYYADKVIDEKDSDEVMGKARGFFDKSKEIVMKLNEEDIEKIINRFKEAIDE